MLMILQSENTSFFHYKIFFFFFSCLEVWLQSVGRHRDHSAHQAITVCGETGTSTSPWGSKELVNPLIYLHWQKHLLSLLLKASSDLWRKHTMKQHRS